MSNGFTSANLSTASAVVESLEGRQLFAATYEILVAKAAREAATVIGASTGNTPSATNPKFLTMSVVNSSDPDDNSNTSADLDTAIRLTIDTQSGHGGVDATNLIRSAVQITNLNTGDVYSGSAILDKLKTSGGGDTLILQPTNPWAPNTTYKVEINGNYTANGNKVRTVDGTLFDYYTANFTTGSRPLPQPIDGVSFSKTLVAGTENQNQTSPAFLAVTMGPDGKLYASTSDGYIYRWTINADGTLSNQQIIDTVLDGNGGAKRIVTGITFDPGSTADHLVLWVSHGQYRFGNNPGGGNEVQKSAQNYTGKVSVLSGPNLETYRDMIVGIPRSVKDHINNQIVFDPKGKNFYFAIPSMNAMGAADATWGNREENLFAASIVRVKLGGELGLNKWVSTRGPIDLTYNDATGATQYNIYKGTNPLRFFATGVRNAFDLLWHTNGHLYTAVNGSSAGGNVPATPANPADVPVHYRIDKDQKDANGNYLYIDANGNYKPYTGPSSPALTNVQVVEQDTLLDLKEGAYYGHPNPTRGEYIFAGGNPTAGPDPFEIAGATGYPIGQLPDRNYHLPVHDFGQFISPNGLLEYKAVGGKNTKLHGYILVARYSSGSDIIALKVNADGSIREREEVRIPGLYGLHSPLDMVQDPNTGNIYVTELLDEVERGAIVLLKPTGTGVGTPDAVASVDGGSPRAGFYVKPGGKAATKRVTLFNDGDGDLILDVSATKITGANRRNFGVTNLPTSDVVLRPGESITLNVIGALAAGQTSTAYGNLALATNDPDGVYSLVIPLRAFNAAANSVAESRIQSVTSAVSETAARATFGTTPIGLSLLGTEADADEAGQDLSELF